MALLVWHNASAAAFMSEFYRRLEGGAAAADALCQTKRAMIKRGKLPLHWAAFVLLGE
jgi:CHAT domain-containing protein